MYEWFENYLRAKAKAKREHVSQLPPSFDEELVYNFTVAAFNAVNTAGVKGSFAKAEHALESLLTAFYETVKPHFQGTSEWFPYLLGIEAGLLIAKEQLRMIREKRGG